jgi:hypothetical protein
MIARPAQYMARLTAAAFTIAPAVYGFALSGNLTQAEMQ